MSVPADQMDDQLNPFRIDEPAPTMPEPERPYALTLQDIKENRNLWEAGALPGDQVSSDNTLIRKFSSEEDSRTTKYRLTEADIIENPNLQAIGAEPGDLVDKDNTLIKTDTDSAMRQFMYGFDESGNDVTNLGAWLEQYIPIGNLSITDGYISANEVYGEGYVDATPEIRRDMQARARERDLLAEYGEDFQPGGVARTLGGVGKALATPTTLLPVGQTIKGATGIGAGLGFGYSATEQLARTGKIDPVEALPSTVIGGVGAGALTALFKGISKGGKMMAEKSSRDLVTKVQAKTYQKQTTEGLSREKAFSDTLDELGVSREEFSRAATLSGNKVRLTANTKKASDELDAMLNDSAVSRLIVPSLDKYLGTLSTRIKNISEPVFGAVRKFEFNTHAKTANTLAKVENFSVQMGKLSDSVKNPLARMLNNGNFKAARGILKQNAPDLLTEFDNVIVPVIRGLGSELEQAGYKNIDLLSDYFPRLVKDLEGLRLSFGIGSRGEIDKAVIAFAKSKGIDTKNTPVEDLYKVLDKSDLDRVVEKVIRNEPITLADGNLLKPRKIDTLRADQLKFYASPEEALQMYIRRSIHDVEKRNLFGRGVEDANTEASIQRYVVEEIKAGNIKADQQQEIVKLLKARFVGGEEPLGSMANFLRDTGYAGTIANPLTAIVQLGDLAQSAAFNGLRNTIASMFGTKNVKAVELGVTQASADLLSPRKTAATLNWLFRKTGFTRLDQFSKETTINAAMNKYMKGLSSTNQKVKDKTLAELRKKYAGAYGDEFDSLVDDLARGRYDSENVKLLAFHELSDFQPISLSEMPEAYLNAKNGRLLYMLKSFTLKQYDLVRRNIYQEAKQGNIKGAARNAAVLAGYLSVTNMGIQSIRDMLLGREVRVEDIPSKAWWSLLGVYGGNKYLVDRYFSQGDIKQGAIELLVPATPLVDSVFSMTADVFDEDKEFEFMRYVRPLPGVGPFLYSWFGGGAERYNERLE